MIVIGLTGGIASGKSTVSSYLKVCGLPLLDADAIAYELSAPGKAIWECFVEHFGRQVLAADGTLQREAIARRVFANQQEQDWLDGATHPLIQKVLMKQMEHYRQEGAPLLVLDVPLLFETGWNQLVDAVWVVYVNEATQLQRLCQRNGYDEETARRRIAAQMSLEEKKQQADVIIDNNGSQQSARLQVDAALACYDRS